MPVNSFKWKHFAGEMAPLQKSSFAGCFDIQTFIQDVRNLPMRMRIKILHNEPILKLKT